MTAFETSKLVKILIILFVFIVWINIPIKKDKNDITKKG